MANTADSGAPPGFGKGLIPSEPDWRDYQLSDLFGAAPLAAAFPSSFTVPSLPPVTNQGDTPQCVAYVSAYLKAWQDRSEGWINFWESLFFTRIGGNASGAALRSGMIYMLNYGYPPEANAALVGQHKIKAYYAASLAGSDLKAALMSFGPLVVGLRWPESWSHPKSNGQVPYPSGVTNGHAILCVGWVDGLGFLFQNSWGTLWGKAGRCYIPSSYIDMRGFEAWKAIDAGEAPTPPPPPTGTKKYAIVKKGARIRASYTASSAHIAYVGADTKVEFAGTGNTGTGYYYVDGVRMNSWSKILWNGTWRWTITPFVKPL